MDPIFSAPHKGLRDFNPKALHFTYVPITSTDFYAPMAPNIFEQLYGYLLPGTLITAAPVCK
jgi:hypothetical protein